MPEIAFTPDGHLIEPIREIPVTGSPEPTFTADGHPIRAARVETAVYAAGGPTTATRAYSASTVRTPDGWPVQAVKLYGGTAMFTPDRQPIWLIRRAADPAADSWKAAVIAGGGTVADAALAALSAFITAERLAGTWDLTDDYWGLWAGDTIGALTSLKQRRMGISVSAPSFVPSRGYTFNGTTQYLDTGFIPSTMAVALLATDARIAVYERTDSAVSTYTAGIHQTTSRSLRLSPRTLAGTVATGGASFAAASYTLPVADSRGFTAMSRTPVNTPAAYKNGVAMVQSVAPASYGAPLPDVSFYIGCFNLVGTGPSAFRASSVGFVCVGASLTPAQEAAQYANVQAWATAVGANV